MTFVRSNGAAAARRLECSDWSAESTRAAAQVLASAASLSPAADKESVEAVTLCPLQKVRDRTARW